MVHSFLDVLPLAGLAVLAVLHLDQLRDPQWQWAWRAPAPSGGPVLLALGALVLAFALIVEEWWRGQRFTS